MRSMLVVMVALGACGKSGSSGGAASEPTTYDLSKAGPAWQGFTAKLPRAGAEVMQDGVTGARLATNGRDKQPFDVAWAPGPVERERAHTRAGTTGTTFTADTAEGVEWKQEYDPGQFSYHFDIAVKVGGDTFHCYTLPMGTADEAQVAAHKAACATLAKAP